MKKILAVCFLAWVLFCSCTVRHAMREPNYDRLLNPDIPLYVKNACPAIDSSIDSLLAIDSTCDIHLWIDSYHGLPIVRLLSTPHDSLPWTYLYAPLLDGYCFHRNHICYIYKCDDLDCSVDANLAAAFNSLLRRTKSSAKYDSIYHSRIGVIPRIEIDYLYQDATFKPVDLKNTLGMVSMDDCKMFTNITPVSFQSDNETSSPTLFTMRLPKTASFYWYGLGSNSQYIFTFGDKQFLFVFDKCRPANPTVDSLSTQLKDGEIRTLSKNKAIRLIRSLESNSADRDFWLAVEGFPPRTSCRSRHYVAMSSGVVFVFYNICDLKPHTILDSFHVVRRHSFKTTD